MTDRHAAPMRAAAQNPLDRSHLSEGALARRLDQGERVSRVAHFDQPLHGLGEPDDEEPPIRDLRLQCPLSLRGETAEGALSGLVRGAVAAMAMSALRQVTTDWASSSRHGPTPS